MLPLAFSLPDSNWTSAVIVGVIVGVYGWWQKRGLAVKVETHGDEIAGLKQTTSEHNGRIAKLEPPPTPHRTHCSSTEQLHRALHVQNTIHKHHEPPKEK